MGNDTKDYAKYFNGSYKVIDENDNQTKIQANGRRIAIYSSPDYRQEKQRGKEDVVVHYDYQVSDRQRQLGRGRKYYIATYGCQMNEHDTETLKGLFEDMNYVWTDERTEADVILLNTCAVRENAEDKVFGELGHLKKLKRDNPELILGVCGCMSQEEAVVQRLLQTHAHIDLIFGTHNIHRLPALLEDAYYNKELVVEVWSKEGDIVENLPKKRVGRQAWVNIMYGCDKFCTYCIVPYTRGKERSRLPEDVIAEVRDLARQGYQEIMLLGQNVNAYGKDFTDCTYTFGHLLDEIRKIDIPRVRFTTSHPRDFDDHLIDVLGKGGNLVEHIHLPVQSGSNAVLKQMARKYTREHYLDLVRKIRAVMPDVVFTTDIIVGFPDETEEQFEETIRLVQEVGFESAYTFIYSPREGTPAYTMGDSVEEGVKKARLHRLNEVLAIQSFEGNRKWMGRTVEVFVEGKSARNDQVLAGRTRTNKLVHFSGNLDLVGQLVYVTITEHNSWVLKGEHVKNV